MIRLIPWQYLQTLALCVMTGAAKPPLTSAPGSADWIGALKNLIFGFDGFVSYSHEAASMAYARRLEQKLAERDLRLFRDETNLEAGSRLTLRIRLALRRTRFLIVLGTERALGSEWVKREISLFAGRDRPIVPLDLQDIRARHSWEELGDSLFEEDDLATGPSDAVIARIAGAAGVFRVNRLARYSLSALGVASLLAGLVLFLQSRSLVDRAEKLRNAALISFARSAPDPLQATLVLAELDPNYLDSSPATADLVRELARQPIAAAVLRTNQETAAALAFSPDGQSLATADRAGVVRSFKADGRDDPTVLAKLPFRPEHLAWSPRGDLLTEGPHGAAVLGRGGVFTPEKEVKQWKFTSEGSYLVGIDDAGTGLVFQQLGPEGRPGEKLRLVFGGAPLLDFWSRSEEGMKLSGAALAADGSWMEFRIQPPDRAQFRLLLDLTPDPEERLLRNGSQELFFAGGSRVAAVTDRRAFLAAAVVDGRAAVVYRDQREIASFAVDGAGGNLLIAPQGASVLELIDLAGGESKRIFFVPPPKERRGLARFRHGTIQEHSPLSAALSPVVPRVLLSPAGDLALRVTTMGAEVYRTDGGGQPVELVPGSFFAESVQPALSQDGLLAIADLLDVRIWRAGEQADPLRSRKRGVPCVGESGAVVIGDREGQIWTGRVGDRLAIEPLTVGALASCAIDPAGERAIFFLETGEVVDWDLLRRSERRRTSLPPGEHARLTGARAIFLSEDWVLLNVGDLVSVWSPEAGSAPAVLPRRGSLEQVKATAEGEYFFLLEKGEERSWLRRFSATGEAAGETQAPESYPYWDLAASADGTLAAITLEDGQIFLWPAPAAEGILHVLPGFAEESITAAALSREGGTLAVGTNHGWAALFAIPEMRLLRFLVRPGNGIVSGSTEAQVAHLGIVTAIDWSGGSRLATRSGMDGTIRLWNEDGGLTAEFAMIHGEGKFFEDFGRLGAAVDEELFVWQVDDRALLTSLRRATTAVLLPADRIRYLAEDADTALMRYQASEAEFGRTPLPREYGDVRFLFD